MRQELCQQEDQLLDALGRGFLGSDLEEHIAACPSCSELHLVAGAVLTDRADAVAEAPIPSSGRVWWRMRLRLRQEAAGKARQSLLVGQALTLTLAVGLLIAVFGIDLGATLKEMFFTVKFNTPLLLAAATGLLLLPIAGWVVIRQK